MTASSSTRAICSKGICHGLPDLSDAPHGLTAIVTGANGISGAHMIDILAQSPERWTKIYALSRRPPSGEWPKQVEHVPLDFLKAPDEIASTMKEKGIKADYVFFFSYVLVTTETGALDWGDQGLVDKNNQLLSNFLEALPLVNSLPKRVFVQFGAKRYGMHLGPTNVPDEEDDPRVSLEPNLYYTQEDMLRDFCSKHNISWNAANPCFILGAAEGSDQSLLYPLFVYASVQKHLGKPLIYPGDATAWAAPQSLSSGTLNSYLYEWSVLAENTANEAFNASDDCAFTWGKAWPRIAEYFGMEYTTPDDSPDTQWIEKPMKHEPPPRGFGKRGVIRLKFSFVDWAKQTENVNAWKELCAKHNLRAGEWKDVGSVFGRVDWCLGRSYSSVLSSTKAKKFGFFGFVDSYESICSVADEFVAMKVIPPAKDK